jgi:hypothetical protein
MNRNGPVLAWCAAAYFLNPVCGDTMLRSSISEECANGTQSEHWCGAANQGLRLA